MPEATPQRGGRERGRVRERTDRTDYPFPSRSFNARRDRSLAVTIVMMLKTISRISPIPVGVNVHPNAIWASTRTVRLTKSDITFLLTAVFRLGNRELVRTPVMSR